MSDETERVVTVRVDVEPAGDIRVFRFGAADDVLRLLVDAHEAEFQVMDLVGMTGYSRSTVWRAVDLLESVGVVDVRRTPDRNYVSIDPERLHKDDPVLGIEQVAFHEPIRRFVDRVESACDEAEGVDGLLGIVVFGSVARGQADRRSDIDVFVLVDGDRSKARRVVHDVACELRTQPIDGDRYTFELFVETPETATRAAPKLEDVFENAVTIRDSPALHNLRRKIRNEY